MPASASLEASSSSPPSPAAGPPLAATPAAPRKKLRPLPSSTGKNAILLPTGEEGGTTILFRARNETKSLCLSMLLSEPSADEECPITMEPIARSYLHFLPGVPLFEEHPLLLKATLQACNHSFSATALLFHFACSGMACPCCRQGNAKEFLHVAGCLPERIARPVQEYVQAMRRKEGEEAHRENTEAALAILRESEGEFSLSRFLRTHRVAMFIYAFEDDSSVRPLNVSELPMNLQEREHDVTLTAPRHSIRAWTGNLNAVPVTLRLLHRRWGPGTSWTTSCSSTTCPACGCPTLSRTTPRGPTSTTSRAPSAPAPSSSSSSRGRNSPRSATSPGASPAPCSPRCCSGPGRAEPGFVMVCNKVRPARAQATI